MQASFQVIFPGTDQGVKIVLSIAFGESRLRFCFRCIGILLGESTRGRQEHKQAVHYEISANVFDRHRCLL
jgi:hypothetical protein